MSTASSDTPIPPRAAAREAQLVRALGVRQLAAAIFNYTVGSGIFALPALAVARLGAAAPLAYLVCALVMACVVLCFAEAGGRVALTGGPYAYVEFALGPLVGFLAGTLLVLTGLSAGAAVAVLFARSVASGLALGAPVAAPALVCTVIAALALVNLCGVRHSARVVELMTLAKLVPLVGFVLLGAAAVHPQNLVWHAAPSLGSVLATAGVVIFAFSGIESALAPSGEVSAPARTIPRAAGLALSAATALYLAIQGVALGIQGPALAANPTTPLADAAAVFGGSWGRAALILGASISMLGYLSGNLLAVPRSLFALGRDGFLPSALSAVHPRFHTPHAAILVYAMLLTMLALSGTFERLAVFANLTAFVLYILCAVAVLVLRRRDVRAAGGEPFRMPGGALVPVLTVVANVSLILATAAAHDLLALAALCALSVLLYVWRARRRRTASCHNGRAA